MTTPAGGLGSMLLANWDHAWRLHTERCAAAGLCPTHLLPAATCPLCHGGDLLERPPARLSPAGDYLDRDAIEAIT
jgi:hypothetical protein